MVIGQGGHNMEDTSSSSMDEAPRSSDGTGEPLIDLSTPYECYKKIRAMMDEAEEMPIENNTIWYLVSTSWMHKWARWCKSGNYDTPMDPIDNSDLEDHDNVHLSNELVGIRATARERRDYYVLPEECWDLLVDWYGVAEGEQVISRRAYEYAQGETRIETHLAKIMFTFLPSGHSGSIQISHDSNVALMKTAIDALLKYRGVEIPEKLFFSFTLSSSDTSTTPYSLDESEVDEKSLDEVGLLVPECYVWVGDRPDEAAKSLFDQAKAVSNDCRSALQPGAGLVGLRNLGNTCFMNSALQCLSNCDPLKQFFLSGKFVKDINRTNRLGTGGNLVEEFAALVRNMWTAPSLSVVDPMGFKYTLGRYEGRFLGYHQQDSQEFLSALLDRVHEDLNRIHQKPYTETPDRNGRPDEEVAAEAWQLHLSRNDSKIVDLFHGQLKSTVTCPSCGYVSVTFDPFMFLSLPIPVKKPKTISTMVFSDTFADQVDIQVPKTNRTIAGFKEAILKRANVDPATHSVVLVEVFNGDIYQFFLDDDFSLLNIKADNEIHAHIVRKDKTYVWVTFSITGKKGRLGIPILLPVGPDVDKDKIVRALAKYAQNPRLESDQMVVHPRKRERASDSHQSFHIFMSEQLVAGLVTDLTSPAEESEDERILQAYFRSIFQHHSRLPYSSAGPSGREEVGLYECLDSFVQAECLSRTESWYCSKCKDHQEGATKKFDLWRLPEVLVIHLKRFAYDSMYGHKISTPVAFPVSDLDFTGRLGLPNNLGPHYELFAISDHYGGLGGGHYTALAKNSIDRQWYNFDDSHVSPVAEDRIKDDKQAAYLLFYQRKQQQ